MSCCTGEAMKSVTQVLHQHIQLVITEKKITEFSMTMLKVKILCKNFISIKETDNLRYLI